VAHR
jgi:hypothetical protein